MKSLFTSIFTHYFRYESLFQDVQLMKTSKQNFNICRKMDDINLSIAATAYTEILSTSRIGRGAIQRYVEAITNCKTYFIFVI